MESPVVLGPILTEPGIYPGLTRADYDTIPAVNQSCLKHFRRSPAHARQYQLSPPVSTPAQELGTLIHCAMLEPARYASDYIAMPDFATGLCDDKGKLYASPRATNKYKALVAEFCDGNPGKVFIEPEQKATCDAILEAVAGHETAARLLDGPGENELGIVWTDPETGLLCKALIDRLTTYNGQRTAVDLKFVDDASPGAFVRSCAVYGWHIQAPFYLWGLKLLGRAAWPFVHVVCETSPPYGIAVYELDEESFDQGWREARQYLNQYAACKANGHWPSYPDRIESARLPGWRFTDDGKEND